MAVNESGNLGDSLREGLTDGVVRKANPDRGGAFADSTVAAGMGESAGSYAKDEYADRLHDGEFFGEEDQDTTYTWVKTDDIGRNVAYPSH